MSTEVSKPSMPSLKWDNPSNFWDEELFWDSSGYPDIDKPLGYTESEKYLLINDTDFLEINDSGDKLIIGIDQNSIYNENSKPTGGIYNEIIKP